MIKLSFPPGQNCVGVSVSPWQPSPTHPSECVGIMRQWCLMDSESRKRPDEVDDVFLVVYEERSVARSDSFRHQDKKRGRFLIPFTTKTSRNDWVAPRESPAAREQRRKKKKNVRLEGGAALLSLRPKGAERAGQEELQKWHQQADHSGHVN